MNKSKNQKKKWEFWIDRGGTFTDIIAKKPDGSLITCKVLTDNPRLYQDPSLYAIRNLMAIQQSETIPTNQIHAIKMGTTIATNALLEKKGEATALIITKGFGDMLRIGYQNRPELFALKIVLPPVLYKEVLEINERYLADGREIIPLHLKEIQSSLRAIYLKGIRSIAIVLMHGFEFQDHEKKIASLAKKIGFKQISVSHEVSPRRKIVTRGNITVVDAYLTPLLQQYRDELKKELKNTRVFFMQSHGGLVSAESFRGKDSILSGPAAGVIAAVTYCLHNGMNKIISFDMGGTSTDVAHYHRQYERSFEIEIAGYKIQSPMLSVNTIAAGGGSILAFSQGRFVVGPKSAGAKPGPACYGNGGPLTITDCHVLLGRIQADFFPKVFGKTGKNTINLNIVKKKFQKLLDRINQNSAEILTIEQAAKGFLNIAVLNMANAIKKISTQRGYDLSQYTLCCFGGAGPQHACNMADVLGMPTIFIPKNASVFSAFGLGLAEIKIIKEKSLQKPINTMTEKTLVYYFDKLALSAKKDLNKQKVRAKKIINKNFLRIKYKGSDVALLVQFRNLKNLKKDFEKIHRRIYGFVMDKKELLIDSIFVELTAVESDVPYKKYVLLNKKTKPKIFKYVAMYTSNHWQDTPLYRRNDLKPGDVISGPALIVESYNTIIVETDWEGKITSQYDLILQKKNKIQLRTKINKNKNPIMLEIFNHLFSTIAEQMGYTLANTAYSVNIKERLDYSCAIFDARGKLIANAQHIPVHLGSMSKSVQAIIRQNKNICRGDVFLNNNPYQGGTHLPDLTVISPVFILNKPKPFFYVASRGHHADIGGITPGSMPPLSKHIEEEGILIDNFKIIDKGRFREKEFLSLLTNNPWPARNTMQNLADIKAQIAANQKGILELQNLIEQYTVETIQSYIKFMRDNAIASVQNLITKIKSGKFSYSLDNGSYVTVQVNVDKSSKYLLIDFTGTSLQQENNFNAPMAVCYAAILYVFRTLIRENIPMNEGVIKPIRLIIPKNSMLNPNYPAAIVAGNVETSQCIVDTLYGALKIMAASQGTMNNFTFGNAKYQYYETLCGGSGAGPGFNGTDAVHTHMTNSRLTDPEVLEAEFPIVIEAFQIRKRSGGSGKWRGGNGVIRKIRFLQSMTVGILSNRRKIPPYGMAGGQPGKRGINYLIRANGKKVILKSSQVLQVEKDDVLIIATPGGGGYGEKS